jgi:uncharacterized membrane protein YdjX (TVP38/TMEM64 family)
MLQIYSQWIIKINEILNLVTYEQYVIIFIFAYSILPSFLFPISLISYFMGVNLDLYTSILIYIFGYSLSIIINYLVIKKVINMFNIRKIYIKPNYIEKLNNNEIITISTLAFIIPYIPLLLSCIILKINIKKILIGLLFGSFPGFLAMFNAGKFARPLSGDIDLYRLFLSAIVFVFILIIQKLINKRLKI